jgi:ribA/ribD-fused uncharacterized protein
MLGFKMPGCDPVVDTSKIDCFDGSIYAFLSNFYPSPIMYDKKMFDTVEHFFQAHKTLDGREFEEIRTVPNPGSAKRLGNSATLRPDWENVKDDIMFLGLLLKFTQNPELASKLIATKGRELEEGNHWGDKYWGTVNGEGKNMLGLLLMEVREIFTHEGDIA